MPAGTARDRPEPGRDDLAPATPTPGGHAAGTPRPLQVEHEYRRKGALQLFAACDTRSGQVYGECFFRKRQAEYLTFLEQLDRVIPAAITAIHLLADNVSVHHGRKVRQWLARHPRFVAHFTPVHCSWINPIEQWFSILRRKRLRHPSFTDLSALARSLRQFIAKWNQTAHLFNWTVQSFDRILAGAEAALPEPLPEAA